MARAEALRMPRAERSKIDHAAHAIWESALRSPGFATIRERVERGVGGYHAFYSDQGNISGSFVPSAEEKSFSLIRTWEGSDGLHREATHGLAENAILGILKLYDMAFLEHEIDGVTVFGKDAIEGAKKLLETVKKAKPLPPKETDQPTSAS